MMSNDGYDGSSPPAPLNNPGVLNPSCFSGLPIYSWDKSDFSVFYAPGYLTVTRPTSADALRRCLCGTGMVGKTPALNTAFNTMPEKIDYFCDQLRRYAEHAVVRKLKLTSEDFRPIALTLFMNNECNLNCIYCHANHTHEKKKRLDLAAIQQAADLVAKNCREKSLPLLAVFHGGGEPLLHPERVDAAMDVLKRVANKYGTLLYSYVATNGIMSEKKANWLADRFDLIGLSCDGPPDIQNRQRPLRNGQPNARVLERTGRILHRKGSRIHVRTTITRATIHRQEEIAAFICNKFAPEEIHFEPIYAGAGKSTALVESQADAYVSHFLKARELAERHNTLLIGSGSRPGTNHGPYCNVFRSVLNLVPGGIATACFKISSDDQIIAKNAKIGEMSHPDDSFQLDQYHIRSLYKKLDTVCFECSDCFNQYHCARACPDLCPLDSDVSSRIAQSFRCRVHKAIAYADLMKTAKRFWHSMAHGEGRQNDNCGVVGGAISFRVTPFAK